MTTDLAKLEALLETVPAHTALTTLETNMVLNALPELLKAARDGERLHRLMEHATTIEVDGADYVTFSINWNYTQLLPDYNEDEPDSALRAAIDDAMKEASRG